MKKACYFLFAIALYAWSQERIATVTEIKGEVTATQPSLAARSLSLGSSIFVKDTIIVLTDSAVQIEYLDATYLLLKPDTKFYISEYRYTENGANNQNRSDLVAGGFRILSGDMTPNPNSFNVKTPNATIGLLGTLVDALLEKDMSLYVACTEGHAEITNATGSIIIGEGMEQYAIVTSYNRRPSIFITPPPPLIRPSITPNARPR